MDPVAIVLMGVTGSGKTTVGVRLAERLGCRFCDGDDFHPPANIEKMSQGVALTDADREPWLDRLRGVMEERLRAGESVVVGCSALREKYRERLLPADSALREQVRFAYLRIPKEAARERLRARAGHFMPASLVDSQFDALEEPSGALVLDATAAPDAIVETVMAKIATARQ